MNYHPDEKQIANLKHINEYSEDEAKAMRYKGGVNSGKTRREKRTLKTLLELALSQKVTNKNGEKASKKEVSAIMLADKCMRGDIRAIELAMNILGENPIKKMEVTGKDGTELIPAKRLSKEEAAGLMASLDSEY